MVSLFSAPPSGIVPDTLDQAKLQAEVEELRSKADARREALSFAEGVVDEPADVSMDLSGNVEEVAT